MSKTEITAPLAICTILKTELYAIFEAVQNVITIGRNVKIFTDCMVAINTLAKAKLTSPCSIKWHELLRIAEIRIEIAHCLGHTGIPGSIDAWPSEFFSKFRFSGG